MNKAEFDEAMSRSEFRCKDCKYRWFSSDLRRPKHCPHCASPKFCKVTGEGQRTGILRKRLDSVLKSLTYREREIIKLRHGIGDGYIYTLREAGRIFKLSHQRIHQIEAKAIRKLQHPVRVDKLRKAGLLGQYAQLTMPGEMMALVRRIRDGRRT